MNAASGIFTAPKTGIYFFSFSGLGSSKSATFPQLYLNGILIGSGWADNIGSSDGADDIPTFTLQSTVQLNAGDQISLKLDSGGTGFLWDDGNHYTHFTGWLLQEDLPY